MADPPLLRLITVGAPDLVAAWEALGSTRTIDGNEIFVVDVPPATDSGQPPLLVLHGFPTSSIDFQAALPALSAERRVVLLDFLGFGFSDKPDQKYSLYEQADIVEAVASACSLDRVDLLTHDMGDSIGGEILARSLDGRAALEIERRVLTNGSIEIDRAVFTDGQRLLLELPDERLESDLGFDAASVAEGLRATLTPGRPVDEDHLLASAMLVAHAGGVRVLPRIIRYIEERREHEHRWTGAIEAHPAPLTVVWGDQDPVAVVGMAEALCARRPDAVFVRLEGIGHYPMLEAPQQFADAVLSGLR